MKEQLEAHQKCLTNEVEVYSSELRDKRDQLDSTWRSTSKELQMSTATEVITKHKALEQKIVLAQPCQYSPVPQLSEMVLAKAPSVLGSTLFCRQNEFRNMSATQFIFCF